AERRGGESRSCYNAAALQMLSRSLDSAGGFMSITPVVRCALISFAAGSLLFGQTPSHQPKVVDAHMHYNGEAGFLDKLLAKLDAVDGVAFLLTTPQALESAKAAVARHPDRLIGFGDIKLDDPELLDLVDRFHGAGFRGLGEI